MDTKIKIYDESGKIPKLYNRKSFHELLSRDSEVAK